VGRYIKGDVKKKNHWFFFAERHKNVKGRKKQAYAEILLKPQTL
jgi:hypothetical protein